MIHQRYEVNGLVEFKVVDHGQHCLSNSHPHIGRVILQSFDARNPYDGAT
jgi:hypothetical protein